MAHNSIAKAKSLSPPPGVSVETERLRDKPNPIEYKGSRLQSVMFDGEDKKRLDPETHKAIVLMLTFIEQNFFLKIEDLRTDNRNKQIHFVRWFFVAKIYKQFRTLQECGEYMCRHHGAIINMRNKYQDIMKSKYPSWEKWVFTQMEIQWLIFQNHEKNKINEVPSSQGEGVDDPQTSGQGHQDNF